MSADDRPVSAEAPDQLWGKGRLGKRGGREAEIVFAQVREDPAVELGALRSLAQPHDARVFCIGSGGCTALSLLAGEPARVDAVDINPAQTHLIALKQAALRALSHDELLRVMTSDACADYPRLRDDLPLATQAFWDARVGLLGGGINGCGKVERSLARAMVAFRLAVHGRGCIERMLAGRDLDEQARRYRREWDGWRWRQAFRVALSRTTLRMLYGAPFLAAVPDDFATVMRERFDLAFTRTPSADNPYLWQTFLGRYPPHDDGLPIYLRRKHHGVLRARQGSMTAVTSDASAWLTEMAPGSVHLFALSNILEVTSPDYTASLVLAIVRAAAPGAVVLVRSIFPVHPTIIDAGARAGLVPNPELQNALSLLDQAPFCPLAMVWRAG